MSQGRLGLRVDLGVLVLAEVKEECAASKGLGVAHLEVLGDEVEG